MSCFLTILAVWLVSGIISVFIYWSLHERKYNGMSMDDRVGSFFLCELAGVLGLMCLSTIALFESRESILNWFKNKLASEEEEA